MQEHAQNIASAETTGYYSRPLIAFFGNIPVADITPAKVKEYTEEKRKILKDGTIRRQLTILSAAFNHARKEGRIETAPFVPMPAQPPAKERWLTRKEAQKLLDACTGQHVRLFVALALNTGQRKGAILDLTWSMVNMKDRVIDFNPPGRAQTSKKRCIVPISPELYLHLDKAHKAKTKHVVHYRGQKIADIKKGFAEACRVAGLKNVTPHTLRHTCGTWLAQAGVDMWQISGILGHSNSRTTELYLKHHPDYLRDAVEKLSLAENLRTIRGRSSQKRQKPVRVS